MRDLNYSILKILRRNRDGSYATQASRSRILSLIAGQLIDAGYRHLQDIHSLKGRHVKTLVSRWQSEDLSIGTIKNRLAAIRWIAEKIGKPGILPSNATLGIENRVYVTNKNKGCKLETDQEKFTAIRDKNVQASLSLQRVFGLRREEAIKFQPTFADRGDKIVLKASWTKGGRQRELPIRTVEQRDILDHVHQLAGSGSLIPPQLLYVQQLRIYERELKRVGLSKMHGLRHQYAQNRYLTLTGRSCPAAGGKTSRELTVEEKRVDRSARLIISAELGHAREQVTAIYLGR